MVHSRWVVNASPLILLGKVKLKWTPCPGQFSSEFKLRWLPQLQRLGAAERDRDQHQSDNRRLSAELEAQKETAKQAKAALDLGAKKIEKLDAALEAERQARATAEKALAEQRVELATLTERASHAEALRRLLQDFQQQTAVGVASRTPRQEGAE